MKDEQTPTLSYSSFILHPSSFIRRQGYFLLFFLPPCRTSSWLWFPWACPDRPFSFCRRKWPRSLLKNVSFPPNRYGRYSRRAPPQVECRIGVQPAAGTLTRLQSIIQCKGSTVVCHVDFCCESRKLSFGEDFIP